MQGECALDVAFPRRDLRQIAEPTGDGPDVTQLSRDGETLLVERDGAVDVPFVGGDDSQVIENAGHAILASEVPEHGERLLERLASASIVAAVSRDAPDSLVGTRD